MTENNHRQLVPHRAKAKGEVTTSWYRLLLEYNKSKIQQCKAAEGRQAFRQQETGRGRGRNKENKIESLNAKWLHHSPNCLNRVNDGAGMKIEQLKPNINSMNTPNTPLPFVFDRKITLNLSHPTVHTVQVCRLLTHGKKKRKTTTTH